MSPRRDACLSCVAAALEPALEWAWIHVQQVQPELGAPPQIVLRGARKLLAAQVLDLALVQVRQQLATQVRERAGRAEHALEARAVRMGTALAHAGGKPRVAPLDGAQKHREAPLRQITAGELRARGPGAGARTEAGGEPIHRVLGEPPIGGGLSPHKPQTEG